MSLHELLTEWKQEKKNVPFQWGDLAITSFIKGTNVASLIVG